MGPVDGYLDMARDAAVFLAWCGLFCALVLAPFAIIGSIQEVMFRRRALRRHDGVHGRDA